jgi:hypothetical protein
LLPASCWSLSRLDPSTLKMEAACCFETSADFQQPERSFMSQKTEHFLTTAVST